MPDNFWGNVLINALGTIFGGLVLGAITALLALWLRRVARMTPREYEKQQKSINEWLLASGVCFGAGVACMLVAWAGGGMDWVALWAKASYEAPTVWGGSVAAIGVLITSITTFVMLPAVLIAKAWATLIRWAALTWFKRLP